MDDGIKLALSVDFKVNLGNYESATVFVCLSGVPVGATEEDIEDYMDTAGLAWEVIRDRVRAQAESLKNRDEPPAVSPARKASPSPTRPAADAKVYSEDEMRELSKWARGIDMDKEAYQAIQIFHGAAWPAALDRAREAGCSSLSQLIDFCISGISPSSVLEYDPFQVRYWHHPESCCVFTTDSEGPGGSFDAALCMELSQVEYEELKAHYEKDTAGAA